MVVCLVRLRDKDGCSLRERVRGGMVGGELEGARRLGFMGLEGFVKLSLVWV